MANYLNCERETNINYNNDQQEASIFSCQRPMQKRLEDLAAKYPEEVKILKTYDDNDGIMIQIPKTWIKVRPPNKLTDEQRSKISERLSSFRTAEKLP